MSDDDTNTDEKIEPKKEVENKGETGEYWVCRLCSDSMLPDQELRLMRSKEGDYNVHMRCYLEALMVATEPYKRKARRRGVRRWTLADGTGYRRRWY